MPKLENFQELIPQWLIWHNGNPTEPGWYWVCADGIWPQVVEFSYSKGKVRATDRHANQSEFWKYHAGPIPDPAPLRIKKRSGK